ncbi:MAG TPA: SpoIIE family protein phosphatase, partial [Bacteroidia bacterium]|nr:SpoIIE family protein phosphatase [Bacteroidia bacterium]
LERKNQIIEEKNKNITDSINYAQRIQKALLASENLLKKNLPEYFVLYQPKDIVSGDFYWAAEKNGKFFIAVCDCTGHGVPGAFMSLLNSTYLNEAIIEKSMTNPADVFGEVRKQLITVLNREGSKSETSDGMDATLISFDRKSNSISFACANNPLLLNRKKELIAFGPDKFPVGMHPDHEKKMFALHQLDLQKGDIIYLLTDGFGDQFGGPGGKKFKIKKLKDLLLEIHELPLQQQGEILSKNHNNWKGTLEQVDDVLVMGIRI